MMAVAIVFSSPELAGCGRTAAVECGTSWPQPRQKQLQTCSSNGSGRRVEWPVLCSMARQVVVSRPAVFSSCRVDLWPARALHAVGSDQCDLGLDQQISTQQQQRCPSVHHGWCGEFDRSALSSLSSPSSFVNSGTTAAKARRSQRGADWTGCGAAARLWLTPVNEWPQPQQHVRDQKPLQVQPREKDKPTTVVSAVSQTNTVGGSIAARKISSEEIPKFHFPTGRPATAGAGDPAITQVLQNVADVFSSCEGGKMYKHQMHSLAKACGLPLYWGTLLFYACSGEKVGFITQPTFVTLWKRLCSTCFDDASKFLRLMARPGCSYLLTEDFVLLIQDIVDTHPGLQFLQDAPEFHSRYIHTVISRIFYSVNRSWSGKITIPELRKSNFLQTLAILEEEEDINQVTDYFSYEHFYVIYCKFWELDKDHDLFISKEDLSRHNDHAISSRIIDRIFSGAVTRGKHLQDGKMSYTEFVWFLLSEEDKKQPRSIEYWFRCMDMDGDGVLSMYEMEYFYEEQVQKMEDMGIEPLPFSDLICQILDMIGPKNPNAVTLADLKKCKLASVVLNTFINLEKYLDQEQKDPFASGTKEADGVAALSDWEKYAAEEYEVLVAEDSGNNDAEASYDYDDDFEPDDEDEDNDRDEDDSDEGRGRRRDSDSFARPATPDAVPAATTTAKGVASTSAAVARPRSAKGNAPGGSAGENVAGGSAVATIGNSFLASGVN